MRELLARAFNIRYTIRGLRRSPGFTTTVILTLALGIGANAAMFNVVDRLIFRPLAYLHDPSTVHRVYWQSLNRSVLQTDGSIPYARYLDLVKWTSSFAQYAAFADQRLAVGVGEQARERRVATVSASYFQFFDTRPVRGRFFSTTEDVTPRGADVVVLAYDYWQSEFGGRDVLGQPLQVGNMRATIIGVAPRGFSGVSDGTPAELFVPITTFAGSQDTGDSKTYFTKYYWGWLNVVVRRKPSVSVESATADATRAYERSWQAEYDDGNTKTPVSVARPRIVVGAVRPAAGPVPALEARTALWVSAVAVIVLLIACANIANLSLARAMRRRRETAVRLALGVSRTRLITQSISEGVLLALLGGVAALLVAQWAGAAIRRMLVGQQSETLSVLTDARTLGLTALLSIVVGVVVGLAPLAIGSPGDLARSLRGDARAGVSEGGRLRASLVVLQATLSVVLLVGAMLFVRSLNHLQLMRLGYDTDRVLLVYRVVRGDFPNDRAQRAMRDALMQTAAALPGVESVAWMSSAPFVSTSSTSLFVAGIDSVAKLGRFTYQATTPDYFRTMGTRILRGRGLTAQDRAGAPLAMVISESMARVLWPSEQALGKCIRVRADTMPCTTVVGIAEDIVQRDIAGGQRFQYYMPLEQYTRTWGNWMSVRVRRDPVLEAERVRKALMRVIPGASYVTVQPLGEIIHNQQKSWRLGATMFVAFGVLALVVAAVGLYGVIGYNVTQRMHELAVRVALGAQRADILRLVVGQSVAFAVTGSLLGLVVARVASRWIEPLLFKQSASDPLVYSAVAALMLVVAFAASLVPALRASHADPNTALRAE